MGQAFVEGKCRWLNFLWRRSLSGDTNARTALEVEAQLERQQPSGAHDIKEAFKLYL